MKKFMTAILAVAMMASLFIPQVSAASERKYVQVLQVTEGQITIDGNIEKSEWDDNNKLVLKAGDTAGPETLTSWAIGKVNDIEFYYSWTKDGIYMAAKTIDANVTPIYQTADGAPTRSGDTFQIAFNPAGLIADDFQGLFFSFIPVVMEEGKTSGSLQATKHNWEWGTPDPDGSINTDNITRIDDDENYKGAWTKSANGWDVEIFLPMTYLASETRIYDLDVADGSQYSLKDDFKPDDPNARKYAFATAMIAYCDYEVTAPATDAATGEGYTTNLIGTGRTTFPETKDDQFWTVDGYPLCLKFNLTGETPNSDTETWAPTEVTLEGGDITDAEPGETNNGSGETAKPGNDTTKPADSADDTTDTTGGGDKGPNVGLIIGIVAAVVVVAGVVVFIVLKKKKN